MRNSADLPPSEQRPRTARVLMAAGLLCLVAAAAAAWFFYHGYMLYYGDAQSHLNISRSIFDSRTPGYDQFGTVWLPMLHFLCLPLASNDWMWRTGLAGSIPVALCLVIAGIFLYLAAEEAYGCAIAAAVVLSCFMLNPNILYLASIPMTEIVFLAGLAALLFALLRFRATQKKSFVALAVVASWWMSLTRYDGWFLIPFAAIWLLTNSRKTVTVSSAPPKCSASSLAVWRRASAPFALLSFGAKRRFVVFIAFGLLASLAPLYWMAHNWWETANPLDFFNGPYSAKTIQGAHPYPGYHDWTLAIHYYWTAGQLCAGAALTALGLAGAACAAIKKAMAPVLFLMLTPVFYIWSMHSSASTPIFVPTLWPHTYYNSRYGIAMVALWAFAAGAIVLQLPQRWRNFALLLPLISITPWLIRPSKNDWICWKESEVNSISRRAWTASAAEFFSAHYQLGQGVLAASATGDVAGTFCRTGIPLREVVDIGNGPLWMANEARPDLLHQALWAVAQAGDPVAKTLDTTYLPYQLVDQIQVSGAPTLKIYRRIQRGL